MNKKVIMLILLALVCKVALAQSQVIEIQGRSIQIRDLSSPCDKTTAPWTKAGKENISCADIADISSLRYQSEKRAQPNTKLDVLDIPKSQDLVYSIQLGTNNDGEIVTLNQSKMVEAWVANPASTVFKIQVGARYKDEKNEHAADQYALHLKNELASIGAPVSAITILAHSMDIPLGRGLVSATTK